MKTKNNDVSSRDFLKTSAVTGAASLVAISHRAHAQGSDKVRVGLIGCGGRGTGAGIIDCAMSSPGIELVALGDLFQDRMDQAPELIKGNLAKRQLPVDDIYKVTPEKMFVGFDAYQKVIDAGVDAVILTTPPFFRPEHFRAAVAAGKHCFVEKPIAVDPVGVRGFIETADKAKEKNLSVVAGTQMRRARHIMDAMKRMHDGEIGELVGGQCVRIGDGMLEWYGDLKQPKPDMSEMEYQIRRWLFMTWLSGDFIVEMHVHNLDLMNWAFNAHPVQCIANGGRQVRTAPEYGDVYDHFAAEFEYPNGVRVEYMGGQTDGVSTRNDMRYVGTKARAYVDFGGAYFEGGVNYKYDGPSMDPAVQEYADFIGSIRNNQPINEGRQVAESTMTAIMARMSAYTGRAMKWDWVMNASKLDLSPEKLELGPHPLGPIPMPGVTKLI
ncbi:MAG TPA: Gfo/Idh/MocA family oxidoreductase [Candidatus Hydrogenedentes bacterium]|nr:Gfo/Idh/MocA family oxidoreductase [Candidatus Hydrogenedentota bacterium]